MPSRPILGCMLLLVLLVSDCSVPGGCTLRDGRHVDVLTCNMLEE